MFNVFSKAALELQTGFLKQNGSYIRFSKASEEFFFNTDFQEALEKQFVASMRL